MSTEQNIYAIKDRAPEFPCWMYCTIVRPFTGKYYGWEKHYTHPGRPFDHESHWSPDAPEAPKGAPTPSPMAGLPTPETDAEAAKDEGDYYLGGTVDADFARSLERRLAAARAEVEALRIEYESRAAWIAKMNAVLGYDNTDGFHSRPDPFEIATSLRAQLATAKEELEEANDKRGDAERGERHWKQQTTWWNEMAVELGRLAGCADNEVPWFDKAKAAINAMRYRHGLVTEMAATELELRSELSALRSDLAKANAAVEEAKEQKVELDGLKLSIKTHNEQIDMPLTKAIVDGARENGIEFVGRSPQQIVEALRAQLSAQQSVPPAGSKYVPVKPGADVSGMESDGASYTFNPDAK